MTAGVETLTAIRQKEQEAEKMIEAAREKAAGIVKKAEEERDRLIKEAEENAKKLFSSIIEKEIEDSAAVIRRIGERFDQQVEKLKREISEETLEKIMRMILE